MNFIGIDLSWRISPPKSLRTAAVVLSESCEVVADRLLSTDEEIIEFIRRYKDEHCIVGMDAPLVVPPKVSQRECERQLLRCGIAVFPAKKDWFFRAFGGVRGEILVEKLKKLKLPIKDIFRPKERTKAISEVYPYSAWKVLFGDEAVPKYKNTARRKKIHGLETLRRRLFALSPQIKFKRKSEIAYQLEGDISRLRGKALEQLGDLLDALLAAYVVLIYWHYGNERCVVLGDLKEGFILTLANECLRKMANKRKY